MGVQIIFTGKELSLSYDFVQFMHMHLGLGEVETRDWYYQEGESSYYNDKEEKKKHLDKMVADLDKRDDALEIMKEVYTIYKLLVTGKVDQIEFLKKTHFIFIVGSPRSGGTYITKQLYNAMGIDYKQVPYSLGHDGFPAPRS